MPMYEYFCRSCHTKHDKIRPITEADAPITCPQCQEVNSVRTLSVVVMHVAGGRAASDAAASSSASSGGHCCGGACGCGHSHSLN